MGECLVTGMHILDALKSLALSVNFLFSGLTFGVIPSVRDIENEKENLKFNTILANVSQSLYILYLVIILIISMYYDYNSVYNIIFEFIALIISIWIIYLLKRTKKNQPMNINLTQPVEEEKRITGFTYFLYYISTLILYVKTLVISYLLIKRVLNKEKSGIYNFEVVCLSLNFFFLLLFTLCLYLPLIVVDEKKKEGKNILTVWSMEYADIIAHLAVCLTYSVSLAADDNNASGPFFNGYLEAYFIIYCINVSLFTLPLPYITNYSSSYHPMIIHTMILDFATDLPFTIVTLAGKTYVGNLFITIDIVVNIITFIRGIIWIPIKFKHEQLDAKEIGKGILRILLYSLAVITAIGFVFGLSIWLIITAFQTETIGCDATGVNVAWSTWFHASGWPLWLWIISQIGGIYFSLNGKEEKTNLLKFFLWNVCTLNVVLPVMYLILGSIGVAMYEQTTEECQDKLEGKMIHAFGIFFIIWSPLICIGCCCSMEMNVKIQ
eukprot:55507_1